METEKLYLKSPLHDVITIYSSKTANKQKMLALLKREENLISNMNHEKSRRYENGILISWRDKHCKTCSKFLSKKSAMKYCKECYKKRHCEESERYRKSHLKKVRMANRNYVHEHLEDICTRKFVWRHFGKGFRFMRDKHG